MAERQSSAKLKRFAESQAEGMAAFAGCKVGAQIHVVLLTQQESQTATTCGQEIPTLEELIRAWRDATDSAECNQPKAFRQLQAILHLGCNHVSVEVAASRIATKFGVRAVYAVAVKRRLTA